MTSQSNVAARAATAHAELAELVGLLEGIRPNYGDIGSRDSEVTAQRARIDRAIELLTQRGHPSAADVEIVAYQVRRCDPDDRFPWEDCTQELFEETRRTGRYGGYDNGPMCMVRELCVAPPVERGPWGVAKSADGKRYRILSDDFCHDVTLQFVGDFTDDQERKRYAQLIASLLNKAMAPPPALVVPEGHMLLPIEADPKQIVMMACEIQGYDPSGTCRTVGEGWATAVDQAERAYKAAINAAPRPKN